MFSEYTRVIPNSGFHPWVKWSRDGKSTPFERTNRLYWTLAYGGFLKSGVPQIIHFTRIFYYKQSSYWGTSIPGNPQIVSTWNVAWNVALKPHCWQSPHVLTQSDSFKPPITITISYLDIATQHMGRRDLKITTWKSNMILGSPMNKHGKATLAHVSTLRNPPYFWTSKSSVTREIIPYVIN
jgi:hypothetical protein